jgi:hypothetical protein
MNINKEGCMVPSLALRNHYQNPSIVSFRRCATRLSRMGLPTSRACSDSPTLRGKTTVLPVDHRGPVTPIDQPANPG